jgi:hypothetical protein
MQEGSHVRCHRWEDDSASVLGAIDAARLRLQQQWHELFREFDVVVYPSAAVPAFPQDHSEPIEARHLDIDGQACPYLDSCCIWADPDIPERRPGSCAAAAFRLVGIALFSGFAICVVSVFRLFSTLFVVLFGFDTMFNRIPYSTRGHDCHESHPLLLILA